MANKKAKNETAMESMEKQKIMADSNTATEAADKEESRKTMREMMAEHIAASILANHDIMMDILAIDVPEAMQKPKERIAWMFANVLLDLRDKRMMENPIKTASEEINSRSRSGNPYSCEEQDILCACALSKEAFFDWHDTPVENILWNMLYKGNGDTFGKIIRVKETLERYIAERDSANNGTLQRDGATRKQEMDEKTKNLLLYAEQKREELKKEARHEK